MRTESIGIETYSPYQGRDLSDVKVFDAGDLELPFGNADAAIREIEKFCGIVLDDGKHPVMMGGEHLVTLGAVRAAAARRNGLRVVHFDAHADLRDEYMGESLSHAAVIRRVWDVVGYGAVYQFGIRSGAREEFEWARSHVSTELFRADTAPRVARELSGRPIYITLDLDVLDPSEFPGTGTPEAGGLSFWELRNALMAFAGCDVVAFDICELSPHYDPSAISTAVACKLLREMLLAFL
jgi:agmatinase